MKPTHDAVTAALAEIIQLELARGNDVTLPGLGTLLVEHQDSRLEEQDGQMVMEPPRDRITFEPAS